MVKLSKIYDFILDLIFPKYCVGCNQEGSWICSNCYKKIIFIKTSFCPICGKVSQEGRFCKNCKKNIYLKSVIVSAHYEKKGVLREAIHKFKYNKIKDISKDLGNILAKSFERYSYQKNLVLIPVPIHKKRLAQRGFNQAKVLAEEFVKHYTSYKINNNLKRIKNNSPQADLPRIERLKNTKDVFVWEGKKNELKYKTVILIDDVFTTGSTLNECAKTLKKQSEAKEIIGLVLGKG